MGPGTGMGMGVVGVVAGVIGLVRLGKLLLSMYLIQPELNSPPVAMCSLILSSVHSVGSSSCKVLKRDSGTVVYLYFFTHTL